MQVTKKHQTEHTVDHVLVSESSRRDASGRDPSLQFESYRDEMDYLVAQKRNIEGRLASYSKAAFAGEQAKIRREFAHDSNTSFNNWVSKKARMEAERRQLIAKKNEVEDEILRIKPLLKIENARKVQAKQGAGTLEGMKLFRDDGTLVWDGIAAQLLLEMQHCRRLLQKLVEKGDSDE